MHAMRRVTNPGSGFDAPQSLSQAQTHFLTVSSSSTTVIAHRADREKRKLIRLDDDESNAVSVAAAQAARGEVDPLDAFMASLNQTPMPIPPPPTTAKTEDEEDTLEAFMKSIEQPVASSSAISASASAANISEQKHAASTTEEEIDPLDAFMNSLGQPTKSETKATRASSSVSSSHVSSKLDLDDEDPMQSFLSAQEDSRQRKRKQLEQRAKDQGVSVETMVAMERKRKQAAGIHDDSEDDDDYDGEYAAQDAGDETDTNRATSRPLALQPVDHSKMVYGTFRKNFYEPSADLLAMPWQEIDSLTQDLEIRVSRGVDEHGRDVSSNISLPPLPRLCFQWSHFNFEPKLQSLIQKLGFATPTAIQSISFPLLTSGFDVLGLAKTGSGKTAAFLWPMIRHVLDQPRINTSAMESGPIALVIAPTRELAEQIYEEAQRFLRVFAIRIVPVMGGMQKHQQVRSLQQGCEVVVATPGRLLDLLMSAQIQKEKDRDKPKPSSTPLFSLSRVTYLVLDEADRMLSLGFESQLSQILSHIRPDAQRALFSATFPRNVERFSRAVLIHPLNVVRIQIGSGAANENVKQSVQLLPTAEAKVEWLKQQINGILSQGSVLVFCSTILACEQLARTLKLHLTTSSASSYSKNDVVGLLHGDQLQTARMDTLAAFKNGSLRVMVATDVASRGIDVKSLPTVVCYEPARTLDEHTHRIGRVGRAGMVGNAISLLNVSDDRDAKWACSLVESFEGQQVEVPTDLWNLASKNKAWSRGRTHATLNRAPSNNPARGAPNYNAVPPPPPPPPAPYAPPPYQSQQYQQQCFPPPPLPSAHAASSSSYHQVPPPAAHAIPPPPSVSSHQPPSLAAIIAEARAKAGLSPALPPPPPPVATQQPPHTHTAFQTPQPPPRPTALIGGVHPSRLAQVPGAAAAMQAALNNRSSTVSNFPVSSADEPPRKKSRWN